MRVDECAQLGVQRVRVVARWMRFGRVPHESEINSSDTSGSVIVAGAQM